MPAYPSAACSPAAIAPQTLRKKREEERVRERKSKRKRKKKRKSPLLVLISCFLYLLKVTSPLFSIFSVFLSLNFARSLFPILFALFFASLSFSSLPFPFPFARSCERLSQAGHVPFRAGPFPFVRIVSTCVRVHVSRLMLLTFETCTPSERCTPAHTRQMKTPRFHDAHVGPA